jgi:hypothetical protein
VQDDQVYKTFLQVWDVSYHCSKLHNKAVIICQSTTEKDSKAICKTLDQRNILHDGVSLKGFFEIDGPFSFVALTKNNPDVLSCSQTMKADDRDAFLKTESKEIQV